VDGAGDAVADVAVTVTGTRILGKPLTSTTNKKGAFTFIVETGGFEILLEKEGYLPQIIKLDARESGIKQVKVVLESVEPAPVAAVDGSGLAQGLGTLTGEDASQLKKGIKALDKGDTAGAAAIFEALTLSSPDKAEPHFYLGMARAETGNPEEAAASFRRTIEIDPTLGQAYFNLGRSLVELEDHDGAATAFDQAVNNGAMDGATCYQLAANIYISRNDYARIAYYLERYCQLKPGEAEMLLRLGSAYFNIGEIDKSVTALEQAVLADPEMVGAHYQLGLSYLNQGMTEQAVNSFRMVVEKAPDSPLAAEASNWVSTLQ
jgi:tetratricopeptide (TPR) repeat protein